MTFEYTPKGVCSRKMIIDVENGKVEGLQVIGGCNGNLQGIALYRVCLLMRLSSVLTV